MEKCFRKSVSLAFLNMAKVESRKLQQTKKHKKKNEQQRYLQKTTCGITIT
jgi:hypothetical protein